MKRFKPYTLGLAFSILFHTPFIYFYLTGTIEERPYILLEPIVVECSMVTDRVVTKRPRIPLPPMSQPPRPL